MEQELEQELKQDKDFSLGCWPSARGSQLSSVRFQCVVRIASIRSEDGERQICFCFYLMPFRI